jgi:hypothetical protein
MRHGLSREKTHAEFNAKLSLNHRISSELLAELQKFEIDRRENPDAKMLTVFAFGFAAILKGALLAFEFGEQRWVLDFARLAALGVMRTTPLARDYGFWLGHSSCDVRAGGSFTESTGMSGSGKNLRLAVKPG